MPIDKDKLRHKLNILEQNIRRLQHIATGGQQAFLADDILQAASLRYLQVAIEAMLDAAHHIVAREGLGIPTRYVDTLMSLVDHGILPAEKRETFIQIAKFRNRIVHLYDEVSTDEVFHILESRLPDLELFIAKVASRYLA